MNTLIVYATKHGCTEKCAGILAERVEGEVSLYNLKRGEAPELKPYDKVIIGGSIHMGKIQKEVREFCSNNLEVLKSKKVGLFICCMRDGEIAKIELKDAFPQELFNSAVAKEYFGGEFIFKRMNPLDRLIVKKVSKIDKDVSNISEEKINRLIQSVNNV